MKTRLFLVLVVAIIVSLSLSVAGGKGDAKSSCCEKGTKASMIKDAKHCDMKDAKMSENCTDADKAAMKKTGAKMMDCCKEKSKASEAKNSKSTKEKTVESKGTN